MPRLYPKVLFFITGTTPKQAQVEEAATYGPGVQFRNAVYVSDDGALEAADAVAGDVPKRYADALPNAKDYSMQDHQAKNNSASTAAPTYDRMSDERKSELNANDLSRGARDATANERRVEPLMPDQRGWQSNTADMLGANVSTTDKPEGAETRPLNDPFRGNSAEAARANTPIGGTATPNAGNTPQGAQAGTAAGATGGAGDTGKGAGTATGKAPTGKDAAWKA